MKSDQKDCILYERKCKDCGECLVCDLDSSKICNNCGRCIDDPEEYRVLNVMEFMKTKQDIKKSKDHNKKEE